MTIEQPTSPSPISTHGEGANPSPDPAQQSTASRHSTRRLGRIALIVLLIGVCGAAAWYWGIREAEPRDDIGRFQGDWKLASGMREIKEGNEEVFPIAVQINGDCWQYLVGGKELKRFRITLNETASPKEIDLALIDAEGKPIGEYRSQGIYTIDRNTARIVVNPVYKPRPKVFDDPDAVVWALTRVKLELPAERR